MELATQLASKTFSFDGLKPTRTLKRSIERQIEKWIEREKKSAQHDDREEISYAVQVESQGWNHYCHCSVRIQMGPQEWQSEETGKNLNDALGHAIQHLKALQLAS